MKQTQNALNLVGRLLVVALFLPAGLSKITGFLGIPAPTLAAIVTIAVEVLGSIALLVGYQTRVTAIVLAIFTLVASIAGHAFWAAPADQAFVAQLLFFKNVAVMGGLLVLASAGAGQWSVDGKNASK
jgi:putative oxidoreductase